ncbi:MAG: cellulase family glycosylhydrolase [Gammaproteobacteria bacterium]
MALTVLAVLVLLALPAQAVPALVDRDARSIAETARFSPGLNEGGAAHTLSPARLAASFAYTAFLPFVARNDGPKGPFAVQLYGSIGASSGFTQAAVARTGWIRFQVRWSDIEPVNTIPAYYNWAALDESIQTATAAGINLILTLESNPAWAAANVNGPVTHAADLSEFVGAIVARYPNVKYWEMYNEPDNIFSFGNDGAAYAAMLNSVYPVIKSANPSAQLVMGGLAMDWCEEDNGPFNCGFLHQVLVHCVQPCFDVANFHYYPVHRANWEPYGRDIIGKANYMRQRLARYGYNRPVINTETGWTYSGVWGNPALQARYVPKTFVRGIAAGLPIINWYAMIDADPSLPGLLGGSYPNYTLRPSYQAFQRLTTLLGAGQYVRALDAAETGSSYVEGYVFSTPGPVGPKRIDVVWYDCQGLITTPPIMPQDCATTAPYRVPAWRIGIWDHLGGPMVIRNDWDDGFIDGWVTLPGGVGTDPIYIDFNP